jgi:hypothetical protein
MTDVPGYFLNGQWKQQTERGSAAYGGAPAGYQYVIDLAGHHIVHNNLAGYQGSFASDSGGRTSIPAYYIVGHHAGFGDMPGVSAHLGIGRHASHDEVTEWTGHNSVVLFDGGSGATSDQVNLYGAEFHQNDYGHDDVAAHGLVLNQIRDGENSGPYTTPWVGARVMSVGDIPSDVAFLASGKWNVGLDLTGVDFGSHDAAVAISGGKRVYLASDQTSPPGEWFIGDGDSSLGDCWLASDGMRLKAQAQFQPQVSVEASFLGTSGAYYILRKSRDGGAVLVNDYLGTYMFQGMRNGAMQNAAYITAMVEAVSTGAVLAKFQLVAGTAIFDFKTNGTAVFPKLILQNLPTSSAGLPAGSVWRSGSDLKIV